MARKVSRTRVVDNRGKVVNDTLENLVTGMGTRLDKTTSTGWVSTFLTRDQVENAFRSDWIARKIIQIPADDATREWRAWQADQDDITAIEELEKDFKMKRKLRDVLMKARLYGGAALVLGVDQGNPEDELIIENVQKDQLKFVHVVTKHDLQVQELNRDVMSPFFGEPLYYQAVTTGTSMRIHPSRVLRFVGNEIPDITRMDAQGWGDPVLQTCSDAVKAAGTVMQSVAGIISDAQVDVVKIPDLTANLVTSDYEDRLMKRLGTAALAKSMYHMLLLDKDEEWNRITSHLAGLDALLQMYLLIVSGAADIPATRMLGQSPAGLSATGESDIRNYYDRVSTEQNTNISPQIEPLDEILIRSSLGDMPDGIFYEWNSLWQMTPEQEADLAAKKATTFQIDVNSAVFPPEAMRRARQNQLIEDNVYPGFEQITEEVEMEQDLPEETDPNEEDIDPANENDPNAEVKKAVGDARKKTKRNLWRKPRDWSPGRRGKFSKVKEGAIPKNVQAMFSKDASPRSLYVNRPVLNAKEIIRWYKSQGFETTLQPADMHVTIIYSRKFVDWAKAGEAFGENEKGEIHVRPGGMRLVERFGQATVMLFASSDLTWRHQDLKYRTEADWDWPDYQPHITISWDADRVDIKKVKPFTGKIILGPERFTEVDDDWKEKVVEDALAEYTHV